MTKWEKWIKEYGKRNYRVALRYVLDSMMGLSRFDQAMKRGQNALEGRKRFYLKNDEKLDLIAQWKGKQMGLIRALALAWCCNCRVECFSYFTPGKELILTYDGYYTSKGCFYVFMSANCETAEGVLSGVTLQEYLETNIGYKESELWRLK